jgi:hypothetical protein
MTPCFPFVSETAGKLVSINERLAIGTQHSARESWGKGATEETAKAPAGWLIAEC